LWTRIANDLNKENVMRIWKVGTVALILAITSACSNSSKVEDVAAPEEASASTPAPAAPADKPKPAEPAKPAAPKAVVIPAGTSLNIVLSDSLNSGKNKAGDTFSGNLSEPVAVNGKTILNKGTTVEGTVVAAEGSGRVSGKANMSLALTSVTIKGKTVSISTKANVAEAESTKGRDAAIIGGGAGVGAAIGAIAGGGKGAAIGAAVGGAGGTGTVLATKGKEVKYDAESKLEFTLDKDVKITL
jgi:hypothetical protein